MIKCHMYGKVTRVAGISTIKKKSNEKKNAARIFAVGRMR